MTVRLLTNIGRLWTGSEILSNAAIVTGDDRIAWVGPAAELRVVDLLDRGVREAQSLETEPAVEAELLQTLGGIAQNLGRLDQADELLERALKLRRAAFGEDHSDVGRSLVASGLQALVCSTVTGTRMSFDR